MAAKKAKDLNIVEHEAAYYYEAFFRDCPALNKEKVKKLLTESIKQPGESIRSPASDLTNRFIWLGPLDANPIDKHFDMFTANEVAVSGLPAELLVRPTGWLHHPLALMLHWPTPTTSSDEAWGEKGDLGSPCPRLIYEKGVPIDDALWADSYLRRLKVLEKDRRSCGEVHG